VDIGFDPGNSSDEERQDFGNTVYERNKLVTQVILLQNLPQIEDYACLLATSLVHFAQN